MAAVVLLMDTAFEPWAVRAVFIRLASGLIQNGSMVMISVASIVSEKLWHPKFILIARVAKIAPINAM